jgi:hypothetical protein
MRKPYGRSGLMDSRELAGGLERQTFDRAPDEDKEPIATDAEMRG